MEQSAVRRAQVLAIDEAHNFLNRMSNRTQQVRASRADHVALFTATPINRGASDLLRLISLLGADNFEDETLEILTRLERRRGDDALNQDELHRIQREIQRFTVRRTKSALNALVDADPEPYRHPDGERICRYPVHESHTYPTGETAADETAATQVRDVADTLVGVAQLERMVAVPVALRREYTDARWLEMRLAACVGLTRHHVLGAMRSSRAALVEHLAGTGYAVETFGVDARFKQTATGDVIGRLAVLAEAGPPTIELDCDIPDWLSDPEAWRKACAVEADRYQRILAAAQRLSDTREHAKASLLADLLDDHPRVLAFDHHLITLAVLGELLRGHGHEPLVATGSTTTVRKEVERRFARSSVTRSVALCSDAMNEGINLQGASAIVHLDLPTTLRVAEQRVGRVDRMDSPHDTIQVWWPHDGPAFATRANELLARRAAESNALLGSNVALPAVLSGRSDNDREADVHSHIAEVEANTGEDWDGIRDALDPVRDLIGVDGLIADDVYTKVRAESTTRTRLSVVRSSEPFAFFSLTGAGAGVPRWLLLRGQSLTGITDLVDIADSLRRVLTDDVSTVQVDANSLEFLSTALDRATATERRLLPRRMQRALDQMTRVCDAMATRCRKTGREHDATRWAALATAAAGTDERRPDPYGLAERWLDLVVSRLDRYAETHRRAHFVLLRDIDADLLADPLDLDAVAAACSGVLTEPPLAERIHVCILGIPAAPATPAPPPRSWGMSAST